MDDWEGVYQKKGKVQTRIYGEIKDSIELFKKSGVKKILDLGCGTGRHTIFLAQNGFKVYGIDIAKSGVVFVSTESKKLGLNIDLKVGNMSKLPYESKLFDAVVCVSVINHAKIAQIKKAFKEIDRVLRPKGYLILRVVSPNDFTAKTGKEIEPGTRIGIDDWDGALPHHFFTKEELTTFLKRFEIIKFTEKSKISERLHKERKHFRIIARKN